MSIFYKIDKLTMKQKKSICKDAYKVATKWWVDILDCNVSIARQQITMPFEDIMKKLGSGTLFSVINQ